MKFYQLGSLKIYHPFNFLFKQQIEFLDHIHKELQYQNSTITQIPQTTAKTYLLFSFILAYFQKQDSHNKFIYLIRNKKALRKVQEIFKNVFLQHKKDTNIKFTILDFLTETDFKQFCIENNPTPSIIVATQQFYLNKLYTIDSSHNIILPSNFREKSIIFVSDFTTFDITCQSILSHEISQTMVRKALFEFNQIQNRKKTPEKTIKQFYEEKMETQFKNLTEKLRNNTYIDFPTNHLSIQRILLNVVKYLLKYLKYKQKSYEVKKKTISIPIIAKKLPDFVTEVLTETAISTETLKNLSYNFDEFILKQKIDRNQVICLTEITRFFSSMIIYKQDLLFEYHNCFQIVISLKDQIDPFNIKIVCLQPKIIFDKFYLPSKSKSQKTILIVNSTSSIQQQFINTNFKLQIKQHFFNNKQITKDNILSLTVTCNSFQVDLKADQNKQTQNYLQIMRSYGTLVNELCQIIPDGIIVYVRSNKYLQSMLEQWEKQDILNQIKMKKLVFVQNQKQCQNKKNIKYFKEACDVGKGSIFIMNIRSKTAQYQTFKNQYSNLILFIGYPVLEENDFYLKQKLEYFKQKTRVTDKYLYLEYDAMRHVNKCLTNILGENKLERKIILFADARFNAKMTPKWLYVAEGNLNISTSIQKCKFFVKNYRKQEITHTMQKFISYTHH